MHGERDYLTRHVFPEVQELCAPLRIQVTPVDLRWGVTEDESNAALEICLAEVNNCAPFFLGLVGERYGWVPETYNTPDMDAYDWLAGVEPGLSVTELEMRLGALNNRDRARAAFYFRDPYFADKVPEEYRGDFESESEEYKARVAALKGLIGRPQPLGDVDDNLVRCRAENRLGRGVGVWI